MNVKFCLLTILVIVSKVNGKFNHFYGKIREMRLDENYTEVPLILTPFIEENKIEEAKSAATVHINGFGNIKSYAGYFTVDKKFNSNMFFWFFPSQNDYSKDPVLLWMQGGPGSTSLIGLFVEHGPFTVKTPNKVELREITWTKNHSIIYMDNPVGTGYSYTNSDGFAKNSTKIGEDLYEALVQFFRLFPELQKNDFFVSGESYAGKYVPAVSYTIHKNNPNAKLKINLKGLSIGNGFVDPINQLEYGEYLYQLGLVDTNTKNEFQKKERQAIEYVKQNEFHKAYEIFDMLVYSDGDVTNATLLKNATGFTYYYNYLFAINPSNEIECMGDYVQTYDVRSAIHVGNAPFHGTNPDVEDHLEGDFMKSVAPWLCELLDHYRVLIYNGQLDIIVPYTSSENYLKNLNFSAAKEYKEAPRQIWRVGNEIAGYAKQVGNLTEVLFRNAGHMAPADQPKWAYDLISRFTSNRPYCD